MKTIYVLGICALLLFCGSCHWFKKDDPTPLEQLPPATQTGERTLGFLLNGQAWTPQGNNGTSNYIVSYDRTYYGGTFDLRAYRYPTKGNDKDQQYIILYMNNLSAPGTYHFENKEQTRVSFTERKTNCESSSRDSSTYATGSLTITRLDMTKGIISGTFEFTLAKPGCDTVRVTDGRFDRKL
jgi:hypothetical protein